MEPEPESGKQREPATEDTVWMPLPFSQRPALQQKKATWKQTNSLPVLVYWFKIGLKVSPVSAPCC